MSFFEFNGVSSENFGLLILKNSHFYAASKEIEFESIPGKSGDIIIDKKRFDNITIEYGVIANTAYSRTPEQELAYALNDWLLSNYGYRILRDSYNPGYFRKAVCTKITYPIKTADGFLSATVTFNCDPFLYSDSGLFPVVYQADPEQPTQYITLINPEMWSAEPVIKFTGAGPVDVIINDSALQFTITLANSIIVDKPNENIYYDDVLKTPCNDIVECDRLPTLRPGANQILILNTSDNDFIMEITPNWGRL